MPPCLAFGGCHLSRVSAPHAAVEGDVPPRTPALGVVPPTAHRCVPQPLTGQPPLPCPMPPRTRPCTVRFRVGVSPGWDVCEALHFRRNTGLLLSLGPHPRAGRGDSASRLSLPTRLCSVRPPARSAQTPYRFIRSTYVIMPSMKALLFALSLLAATLGFSGEGFPVSALPTVWVTGTRPTTWAKGELYVMECWASWCGPCVRAIPHMESLWQTLKGERVHVIGINVGERTTVDEIRAFLAKQPTPPTYAIAADPDGRLSERLGFRGIPFAFVVRDGEIVWRGHPVRLTADSLRSLRDAAPASAHPPASAPIVPAGASPAKP